MFEAEFKAYLSLLEKASQLLTEIKNRHTEAAIGVANEQLRFAGCHASRAITYSYNLNRLSDLYNELSHAQIHCYQAINLAYESAIRECVGVINEFPKDFGETIIPDIISGYADIKKAAILAKDFIALKDLNRSNSEYETHYNDVFQGRLKLESLREDLIQKSEEIRQKRRISKITLVVGILAAIGALIGGLGDFQSGFSSKNLQLFPFQLTEESITSLFRNSINTGAPFFDARHSIGTELLNFYLNASLLVLGMLFTSMFASGIIISYFSKKIEFKTLRYIGFVIGGFLIISAPTLSVLKLLALDKFLQIENLVKIGLIGEMDSTRLYNTQNNTFSHSLRLPPFSSGSAQPNEFLRCVMYFISKEIAASQNIVSIILVGRSDRRELGPHARKAYSNNLGLAQQRAMFMKNILVNMNVPSGKILVLPAGPLLTNKSIPDTKLNDDRAISIFLQGFGKIPENIITLHSMRAIINRVLKTVAIK